MPQLTQRQSRHPKLGAAIKWWGGKTYLAQKIIDLMPPHLHYVEPFFGGGAVLFAKDPHGVSEVVNDLNGDLMNFWRTLQDDASFMRFQRIVAATPFSQDEFRRAGESSDDPIQRAVSFFIRCRQSREGKMQDFATLSKNRVRRGMNEQTSAWLTAVEGLPAVHARLKRVVILNDRALDVIRREDSLNTLFYCDPPYLHDTRVSTDAYAHEMTKKHHSHLLDVLAEIKGRFLLSGYRSVLYDSAADRHGWSRADFEIDCKVGGNSGGAKSARVESVWSNRQ